MNTTDIEKILHHDNLSSKHFVGVYPRDDFISSLNTNGEHGFYVFNTHTRKGSGEHWIAVNVTNTTVSYFDSYGFPPHLFPDVYRCLQHLTYRSNLEWNTTPLQGPFSTVCGDYCVLYGLLSARGWKMERFLKRMDIIPNSETRDHAVRRLIVDLYGPYLTSRFPFSPILEGENGVHIPGTGDICSFSSK